MYYEINVSKEGTHFFATAKRSLETRFKAREMFMLFKEKFPESEGYELWVTCWTTRGQDVSFDETIEEA